MKGHIKQISDNQLPLSVPSFQKKILPLKHRFVTFKSFYDYGNNYKPQVLKVLKKNPKWCHLSLKLGHSGECEEYSPLRRARSLRLRSIHLESYALDSQACGDSINGYFGEFDALTRAGHTLKKLSLSMIYNSSQSKANVSESEDDNSQPEEAQSGKSNVYFHLQKFVKKQKNLDEFGLYMGRQGNSKWMSGLLRYVEKTVKTLTIENMIIENLFKTYEFPKLETLRFEYMLFYRSESLLDFSVLSRSLQDVLALPSLSTLVISQYQRYDFGLYEDYLEEKEEEEDDEENLPEQKGELDLPDVFWEELKRELLKNRNKPLKIKYHKKEDDNIQKKVRDFKKLFASLPESQTFEFEVACVSKRSHEEIKKLGLQVENYSCGFRNFNHYWKGMRYLIFKGQVEPMSD